MYNINLVRDRADHAPTFADRLFNLLPVILLLLYGFGIVLGFITITHMSHSIAVLEKELENAVEERNEKNKPVTYTREQLQNIELIRNVVNLYKNRRLWYARLSQLQTTLPEGISVHVKASKDGSLTITGHAFNADGKGLERIEKLSKKLLLNKTFMEGFNYLLWQRIEKEPSEEDGMIVKFKILCTGK
jgi:Tfp pilus assembly protein PilN